MTFTIKEVVVIACFVAGIAGAWAVTLHKVDMFDARLKRVEGNVQFLIGAYIRRGGGLTPSDEWVLPDFSKQPIPPDVADVPDS